MTMKQAGEFEVGDIWVEDRRRVRMTGRFAGLTPTSIFIEYEDVETGEPGTSEFYRENRRDVESRDEPAIVRQLREQILALPEDERRRFLRWARSL